jgi:hypothetical protein
MRNYSLLGLALVFLFGCARVIGPVSKKPYSSAVNLEYLQEVLEYNRSQYIKQHPGLSILKKQAILEGKLLKGMSKEEVKVSWGAPDIVYRSASNNIVNEQWLYKNIDAFSLERRNVYLNFKGELLHSWFEQ